jgi:predicted nucleic acid-binding protein
VTRLVVADASPIRYLVQIEAIDLLRALFERVLVPSAVASELLHPSAPASVRDWMSDPPGWVEVRTAPNTNDAVLQALDDGERAAISLGLSLDADLILADDRAAAAAALRHGLRPLERWVSSTRRRTRTGRFGGSAGSPSEDEFSVSPEPA